jgi:uncharacterized protein YjbJ (UPF0337 family)
MAGTSDKIHGGAKVAAGAVTGDKSLEREGRVDRFAGDAKDKIAAATDSLEELVNNASHKAGDALQSTRRSLEDLVNKVRS